MIVDGIPSRDSIVCVVILPRIRRPRNRGSSVE